MVTTVEFLAMQKIPLGDILPNPWQPRLDDSPEALRELAESIKQHGLLQPPIGRRRDGKVELAAGHRRWRAYQLLDDQEQDRPGPWATIPVQLRELTDQQMADLSLQENTKRKDLNPIELARAYKRYLQDFKCTQQELAQKVGIAQPTLANTMRLLELPDEVQGLIISQGITAAHGRELLRAIKKPEKMVGLATQAAKAQWPVSALQREMGYAMRDDWELMDDWKCKEFKSSCQSCPTLERMGERQYCTKPSCFEKKLKAVEKAHQEEVAKQFAGTDRLDLSKLKYGQYEHHHSDQIDNPSQCQTCDKLKLDSYGLSDSFHTMSTICLDPSCYKKKQAVKTRETNKTKKDEYEALLKQAQDFFFSHWPALRGPALLVIEQCKSFDIERLLAKEWGIKVDKKNEFRAAVSEKIASMDTKNLWWLAILMVILNQHDKDRYGNGNTAVAKAVSLLIEAVPQTTPKSQ